MISDKKLEEIAREYGTPTYVYDADMIIERYKELHDCIRWPKLKIFFAMKANYNFQILKILEKAGANIDLVSPGELALAKRAGFSADRLLYTANNMTDEEMEFVNDSGVLFNLGSISRLKKYASAYPGSDICIRFNTDVVAGEHKNIQTGGALTKFGILMQDIDAVKSIVAEYNMNVVGLHVHTGSGIADTEKFIESMKNLMDMGRHFDSLRFLDFGGGFKVPYEPGEKRIDYVQFGKEITDVLEDFCKEYGRELEVRFEPGKYIVAEAGHLLVEVNTLKDNRGRLIAGTNSGFPQLIRPIMYDAYHQIDNLTNPDAKILKYDICGNICETGDCFATDRDTPEIREGDILAIRNAGAYCYSMGGIYNLRPMPAEVIYMNGTHYLATKRKSFDELADEIAASSLDGGNR